MNKTLFDGCTLFISARSPFARRVRIAFLESGLKFNVKIVNVLERNPEFDRVNPLRRVPAAQINNGEIIVDSHEILNLFYGNEPQASPWSGIGVGLCERTVEYYLETLRPKEKQDSEILDEFSEIVRDTVFCFNAFIAGKSWIHGSSLTQADIDMACALTYLSLRFSSRWRQEFSDASGYLDALERRPAFIETLPPV